MSRRLRAIVLDDPRAVVVGGEPVRVGDRVVGRVTSGGYGYTIGASIAYAYLPIDDATPGTAVSIDLFGEWIDGAVATTEPLFDPSGARVHGRT